MEKSYKQVTRKDVATLAGVSETVVSYVINNNRYVDKEKRRRVEDAVRQLNYRPNNIARALKGKSSNHIVFIADQIVSEHFSLLVNELDKHAYGLGYMISMCANRNSEQFVNEIIGRCYDGVIISSISFSTRYIQRLIDANIPVVLLKNREYPGVTGAGLIDNGLYQGATDCVRFLQQKGRSNIIYIDRFSARGHFSDMNDLRYRGFVEQMRAGGQCADPEACVITGCAGPDEVARKVAEYLKNHKVDAIFGRNDRLACIAMQQAKELGYRVPEEIAVVGFDNSTLSQYASPTITTVEIPREAMAKTAVEMLQKMIGEGEVPQPVQLHTRLIQRQSTPE